MLRLETLLRDLAEQDAAIELSDLIARIERKLSDEPDSAVVMLPTMSPVETTERVWRSRRWIVAAAAAALVLIAVGIPAILLRGGESTVVDETTTTLPQTPIIEVEAWQRVGVDVMRPVVGLFGLTRAGDRLVAAGFDPGEDYRQDGVIFVSDDATTWVRLAENDPALSTGLALIKAITEGGPGLVAVGLSCQDTAWPCEAGPFPTVWTSADGSAWTRSQVDAAEATFGSMEDVVFTDRGIFAGGVIEKMDADGSLFHGPAVWYSSDGGEWNRVWEGDRIEGAAGPVGQIMAMTVGPDGLVVAGGSALNAAGEPVAAAWASSDETTWERIGRDSPMFADPTGLHIFASIFDITFGPTGFVAVGSVAEGGEEARTQPAIWHSPDGRSWTRVDITGQPFTTGQPFGNVVALGAVAAIDGGYATAGPVFTSVEPGDGPVTLWTSPDGLTWDRVLELNIGSVSTIVATETGIAIAGQIIWDWWDAAGFQAAVWAGPTFDPHSPPAEPVQLSTTTAPGGPTTTLPPLGNLPDGSNCGDLAGAGYSYAAAAAYWAWHEMPAELDPDGNGIPCEADYPVGDVESVYGGSTALPAALEWHAEKFTVSGAAVEAGIVCPSGTVEIFNEPPPTHDETFWRWEDLYTCDDGSGSFIIGGEWFIETANGASAVWDIRAATSDDPPLSGGGTFVWRRDVGTDHLTGRIASGDG